MVESYMVTPLRDMPANCWVFLGLLALLLFGYHVRAYWLAKKSGERCGILQYIKENKIYILGTMLVLYLGVVLCLTVLGRNRDETVTSELIPLWSWKDAFIKISENGDYGMLWQIFINILMFVPIGAMMYGIQRKKFCRTILWCAGFSLTVEVLQLLFRVGLFEWDDIIHNTLGYLLGAGVVCVTGNLLKNIKIDRHDG